MVKSWVFLLAVCWLSTPGLSAEPPNAKSINGGTTCAACTMLVGLMEQLALVHNESIADGIAHFCRLLPTDIISQACNVLVEVYAPVIIEMLENEEPPDAVCHALELCYTEPAENTCHLFREPQLNTLRMQGYKLKVKLRNKKYGLKADKRNDICDIPGVDVLCDWIDRVFNQHLPAVDIDNDYYSPVEYLRGSAWRGKDCNDLFATHYPGVRPGDDNLFDTNCNGISGSDPDSGESYEQMLCAGTGARGVAILGDSASAHFHIPKEWITASLMTEEVFAYLPYILQNELDWPMTSSGTGYVNITWPVIEGPTHSLYMNMRERNRCNHRDFQSISVNGARSGNMLRTQEGLARDPEMDLPLTVIYALIGNDVCNGKNMDDYQITVERACEFIHDLDTKLPPGSQLLFVGLADGRVLYDKLHDRIHPVGEYRQDVKYVDLYNFLACLEVTPCMGWLNSNATLRDLTTQRAMELSDVLRELAESETHENFQIHYVDNPVEELINIWEAENGPGTGWQLIDAVDGFHPNQNAQGAIAQLLWARFEESMPELIGDVNPHNDLIESIFGDQGGH